MAAPSPFPSTPTLILDNGAHSIKAMYSNQEEPSVYRNSIIRSKTEKRNYVADELDECKDFGGLVFRMAHERGILTNWEVEKTVWDRVFSAKGRGMQVDPSTTPLLITEPVFNLGNVRENHDQMLFEEWEFERICRVPGPALIPWGTDAGGGAAEAPECVLVVDAGFSFTHVVPVVRGSIVNAGVRRIDAGGKLLTNHLKELVSFRQWYMMDQTSVIEHAKEECCYVSNEWERDWETANSSLTNPIVRSYVLPDFLPDSTNKLGFVRPPPTGNTPPPTPPLAEDAMVVDGAPQKKSAEEEQLLQMNNERFTVPEVLFNPSTIDLNQGGIHETIAHSISALPEELRGMFWSNIVCVGGSSGFAGFGDRLRSELRKLAPPEFPVRVTVSTSPTLTTALSAASALTGSSLPSVSSAAPSAKREQFAQSLKDAFVTRQEYLEAGASVSRRKFGRWYVGEKRLREECGLGRGAGDS
ncbi:actin family [Leucosporidium creatinivorum]|uniref:Actin-like protein ARP6 n=1 Tax=Leucosporidium creatinivorum TaxID=106004 RepID=A0A1Y2ENH9_9BASI|nr:actin family [Leucosporidium creatinivorum]